MRVSVTQIMQCFPWLLVSRVHITFLYILSHRVICLADYAEIVRLLLGFSTIYIASRTDLVFDAAECAIDIFWN